ncbi:MULTISPECIES: phosphate ABC transporter permease PstA [unclassified Oleiphilus]|uniref:phosphate ABC transporter permease PstA n=2 Tax=Oleiphilus TaxID=141450 RepID=UPI0009EEDA8E|nr:MULTISPECIES: phosphate ABC transporter permease PstA [unclassified Oleiphilus]
MKQASYVAHEQAESAKEHCFHDKRLAKRARKAQLFKALMVGCIAFTMSFLAFFLFDIGRTALPAAKQTYVLVDITYSEHAAKSYRKAIDKTYRTIVSRAWLRTIPEQIKQNPSLLGKTERVWVLADDQVDQYIKGHHHNIKKKHLTTIDALREQGRVEQRWNSIFFSRGDSKSPEYAGIQSAIIGSILTLVVTMALAFPIGVMTAIYLEEFASDNMFTRFVEVNINNLAAIPSILFGLLGLSVFINLFGLPRSSPLVGGITLALMTLPIIIVSSRAALRSVPESIRQAGLGLGLTKQEVVKDHVLPIALPGILTGSIIGLAQAMGETAPLIIIGMIAFIPDSPSSIMEAATVLPAQIFTWAGMPERAYVEKTAAGIVVILSIIVLLNSLAIYLRRKYEVKW